MGEGKGASCGATDQIWCSVQQCGAQEGQIKTQAWSESQREKRLRGTKKENERHLGRFVCASVPLRQRKKRDMFEI